MHKSLILTAIIIMAYAYICDFTASIVRAGLMAIILLLASVVHRQYDAISSLSLAGIVYMLISPLSIFTVGFQLSYLCVFAIITLAPYIKKLFDIMRVPSIISGSMSISIATNMVIFPICANTFDKVSIVGILSNIVVLPIFNVVYIVTFIMLILCSILPILAFVMKVVDILVGVIVMLAQLFSGIDVLIFRVFYISNVAMFLIILALLILKYSLSSTKVKSVAIVIISIFILNYISYSFIPTTYTGYNVFVDYQYSSNVSIMTIDDTVILLGADIDSSGLTSIMKDRRLNCIDIVVAYDIDSDNTDTLDYMYEYGVSKIYISENLEYDNRYGYNITKLTKKINLLDVVYITPIIRNDKILALSIDIRDVSILHIDKDITKTNLLYMANELNHDYDYTICYNLKYDILDYSLYEYGKILYQNKIVSGVYEDVYSLENKYFYDINIKKGI